MNTHELSCSIVRVWKGAHDSCYVLESGEKAQESWNQAANILEVAFDRINQALYEVDMFASRLNSAKGGDSEQSSQ